MHPTVIGCNRESIWRFHAALSENCLVVELRESASALSGPSGAAVKLQIPPSTLEHKIRALKIPKSQFKFG